MCQAAKKLWRGGKASLASPDRLSTPSRPHRDTPGSTSPPHGRPSLYGAFTTKHPEPSHFCHAAPSSLRPAPPHRAHIGRLRYRRRRRRQADV